MRRDDDGGNGNQGAMESIEINSKETYVGSGIENIINGKKEMTPKLGFQKNKALRRVIYFEK